MAIKLKDIEVLRNSVVDQLEELKVPRGVINDVGDTIDAVYDMFEDCLIKSRVYERLLNETDAMAKVTPQRIDELTDLVTAKLHAEEHYNYYRH